MLETLRQYALERLIERGEAEVVQQRHGAHYWSRAQLLAPCWEGRGDLDALAEFERDIDEYRAAVERLIEESDFAGADQLDRLLSWGWAMRYPAESFDRSLRIVGELIDPAAAAARTAQLSTCAMNLGRVALIGGFARDALAIAAAAGLRPPLEALRMLAQDMWFREDWVGLFDLADQYAQAAVVEGSPWHEAWALDYTVGARYAVGDVDSARRLADDVLDCVAAIGNHGLAQGVNITHGFAEMWIDAARAATLLEEARAHGPDRPTALSVYNEALLAVSLAEMDRPADGSPIMAGAVRLADRMGASVSELLVLAAFVLVKCNRQSEASDTLALAERGLAGGAPLWNAARQARARIDVSQLPPSRRTVTLNEVAAMLTHAEGS